jgi:hypothetical protein
LLEKQEEEDRKWRADPRGHAKRDIEWPLSALRRREAEEDVEEERVLNGVGRQRASHVLSVRWSGTELPRCSVCKMAAGEKRCSASRYTRVNGISNVDAPA